MLVDETGSSTAATVSWSSDNTWETAIVDQPGDYRMMKGYLDTGNRTTTTVTVSGLPSNAAGYNVYVYADGSNGSASRTGIYQISGTGITTTSISLTDAANTNFSGTYSQANNSAGNYVVFTINATSFTISATPGASTDGYQRAPVNGIQIVPLGRPTPDFTLSAAPSSQSVIPGGSTSYTVSTGVLNGFSGSVSLSVSGLPAGATVSFSPSSPVAAGSSSTLTITTTASTPISNSTLTITGTSGSLTHTATVTLNVTSSSGSSGNVISIDFVGSDVPMASTEIAGVIAKPNWNNAGGASSSAPLLVDETGSSTATTVSWSSNGTWETPIVDQPGDYRMMKGYLDTANTATTTVTVSGLPSNASGYNVYVYADGSNGSASRTGIYQISGTGITTTSISLTDAANTNFSGTYSQANNSAGNYVVFTINATSFTISATPGASTDGYQRAPVNGIQIVPLGRPTPDFTLSAAPSSQSVIPGGSTSYTVSTGVLNGFSGSVSLSVSGLPAGATISFSPSSPVAAGSSSTLTITTTASTPISNSTLTITGTSGSLTHTATVTLSVAAHGEWAWMSGSSGVNQSGTYGTLGTPALANVPGGRGNGVSWTDTSGNLWLFGGEGFDSTGAPGFLQDLWRYNIGTGEWTWMGGSTVINQNGTYGTLGTPAPANVPGARNEDVSWTDTSGNLWLFGGSGFDSTEVVTSDLNDLWRYNLSSGQWTWMSGSNVGNQKGKYGTLGTPAPANVPGGRLGAVSWTDTSGNLWLFGGVGFDSAGTSGDMNDLWRYNISIGQWTWMSGSNVVGQTGTYGTLGTPAPGNVPGARDNAVSWTDASGNLWLFGGVNFDTTRDMNDLWMYSISSGQWTWMSGSNVVNQIGTYGTQGTPAPANIPGARDLMSVGLICLEISGSSEGMVSIRPGQPAG